MTPLEHLSARAGILPEYHDIWGTRHETSDATRRAILAAMGLPADDDGAIAASHARLDEEEWADPLPPVLVARVEESPRVVLRLPETALGQPLTWRLHLENGEHEETGFLPLSQEHLDRRGTEDGVRVALALHLPPCPVPGYHRLEIHDSHGTCLAAMPLILHPGVCHWPERLGQDGRVWGLTVQLHGVRSRTNWGQGHYGDLARLVDWAGDQGAALVGVNPLHALFPHNPRHASPYSPSSRRYFNVQALDVAELVDFLGCPEAAARLAEPDFQAALAHTRQAERIDHAGVASAQRDILARLYQHFRAHHLAGDTPPARQFRAFQAQGGEELARFGLYHALQEHFHQQDPALWGWPVWPDAYRSPDAPAVREFAASHPARVEYPQWLQWLADRQLAAAGRRALERGLDIGLYFDLAVGVDKAGAEIWSHQALYALDAKVGCPPDDFNPLGQDWGLPPWIPRRLRQAGYAPFIALLQANMKHAGALRLDHVMGLMRLYWVPPGLRGDQGAYVSYPFADLLGILALESTRNRCLVVGEDLGTVPDEVRHALAAARVLSYRLFYFERQPDGHFQPPGHYPRQALVAATTHDLPTLAGYWRGLDLEWRDRLGIFPSPALRDAQYAGRREDRARLLADLAREGLLPEGSPLDPEALPDLGPAHIAAIHRWLARSPACIVLTQAEDLLGETEQANLPGTVDQHPNWRRRLSLNLEDWPGDPRITPVVAGLREERP